MEEEKKIAEETANQPQKTEKRKRRKLKKAIKIPLIILAVLLGLFALVVIFISPIAHYVIEKHSKELCHRIVTMDDLKINLLKGTVDIKGFKALEENDKDVFVTFDELFVNMTLYKLLGKTVQLTEITLRTPDIAVVQDGSRFNFTDIIEFYKSDEEKDDEPSTWIVDLQNITIAGGKIVYHDAQVGSKFDLRELAVAVPQIYFSTKQTDIGLDLKFADGGDLNLKLLYALENQQYDLLINLKNFDLQSVKPYLVQFLNINDFKGKLTTSLKLQGSTEHILNVVGNGNIEVANISATDLSDKNIASIKAINVDVKKLDVLNNVFQFGNITIDGLSTTYDVYANTHSFSNLVKETSSKAESADTTSSEPAPEAPLQFSIDNIAITNSSVTYNDNTMRNQVSIPITGIDIRTKNFALDNPLKINLQAIVGETGKVKVDWAGSLQNFRNQDINVFVTNVKLPLASPYCMEYLSYPIEDGVLSLVSHNSIKNNIIDSKNKVDIYNCVVGKKNKEVKAEYNIPLRAAIYVLSDRKGKIQFDLPISGDISSPNFSYKKIIFKTLGNLFVKIVAAPFDLIAKALGKDPDIFADIQYDIRPQGLGSEASDKLNKIADAMKEKPDLVLTLQQSVDIDENMETYALFNAKRDYFIQANDGAAPTLDDFDKILNIKNNDAGFVAFVNQKTEGSDAKNIGQKCIAMYGTDKLMAQVNANIERRFQSVVSHFTMQGIPQDRLKVNGLGDKKTPKGKTLLSFGVDVKDE